MFISNNNFLLLLLLSGLSFCLSVWSICLLFFFLSGLSFCLECLSIFSVHHSGLSVFSVCLSKWSVCLSCLSVSLFYLSFFVNVGLGGLSVFSVCLSGLFGLLFLSCFSFCLFFDGCFVCLSFWFVSPSVCLSISLYLYKICLDAACWYLAIQSVFCLVCLSFLSFFIVCQFLSLISLSVRLYIFLVCLCLCLSIC